MPYYPNPFDFVPFPNRPILRTEQEFDALGERVSGYLELELKALTPVHIVGRVDVDTAEHRSSMYRQDHQPCIPASSIRGCLRAFTEALTAGWVSQATPEYRKEYRKRHIGFNTFEQYRNDRSSIHHRVSPPAVNPALKPNSSGQLDVASYLFGIVAEGKQAEPEAQAQKSKVWVEDAFLSREALASNQDLWVPDIAGAAFMGGAKPTASNWWYFEPAEVWKRNLSFGSMTEFVGEHIRGRKFYYHQDPAACVKMYHPDSNFWTYATNRFHPIQLECMHSEAVTHPFRLYLDSVPTPLFRLLMRVLLPGQHIRHKLGYAKAYGYGSIEFVLKSAKLRTASPGIPKALEPWTVAVGNWNEASLTKYGLADFVDRNALLWLARILGWPHQDLLYLYPRYKPQEFQTVIKHAAYTQKMVELDMPVSETMQVTSRQARDIANALFDIKRPIDFRLYQERANGWATIAQRRP